MGELTDYDLEEVRSYARRMVMEEKESRRLACDGLTQEMGRLAGQLALCLVAVRELEDKGGEKLG